MIRSSGRTYSASKSCGSYTWRDDVQEKMKDEIYEIKGTKQEKENKGEVKQPDIIEETNIIATPEQTNEPTNSDKVDEIRIEETSNVETTEQIVDQNEDSPKQIVDPNMDSPEQEI